MLHLRLKSQGFNAVPERQQSSTNFHYRRPCWPLSRSVSFPGMETEDLGVSGLGLKSRGRMV